MPRVWGRYYPGNQVSRLRGALTTSCPDCGAEAGAPCRKFKIEAGKRLYITGSRKTPHPERVSAAVARGSG